MSDLNEGLKGIEANLSTLVLSIASSAAMTLGLAPDPQTQEKVVNLEVAKFNIDLLVVLKDKTSKNVTDDESKFISKIISDLQMQYLEASKKNNTANSAANSADNNTNSK